MAAFSKQFRLSAIALACAIAVPTTEVIAQSATRTVPPSSGTILPGSGATATQAPVALGGYCPVCILEMKRWVKGDPRFSVAQDGKTYLFPGDEQKQMFLKNPDKYTPALGGKCTVCQVEMGKDVDGSVHFAAIHEGRLFLFPAQEQKQMFLNNPAKYANIDLAAGGKCTVCRIELQKDVQGSAEFAMIRNGLRYWFPGEDQRKMFVANPEKYEIK